MATYGFVNDYIWWHVGFQGVFGEMWVGKGIFLATWLIMPFTKELMHSII
jgi:hypothetical protein